MADQTTVIRVSYIWEMLIFKELIRVLFVVPEMSHAFFDLGSRLRDRLSHFLTNKASVVRLIFLED